MCEMAAGGEKVWLDDRDWMGKVEQLPREKVMGVWEGEVDVGERYD